MNKQNRKPRRAPALGRIPPLPPTDVPREFTAHFGRRDHVLAVTVAEKVQELCYEAPRRSRVPVEVALLALGDDEGFSLREGYRLLKAGRFLLSRGG